MEGVANGQVGVRVNQCFTGTPVQNFTTFDFVLNSLYQRSGVQQFALNIREKRTLQEFLRAELSNLDAFSRYT